MNAMSTRTAAVIGLAMISLTLTTMPADAQIFGSGRSGRASADGAVFIGALLSGIAGLALGGLILGWNRLMQSPHAGQMIAGICGLAVFIAVAAGESSNNIGDITVATVVATVFAFGLGLGIALSFLASPPGSISTLFGSSRLMTTAELDARGWLGEFEDGQGLFLGATHDGADIVYDGDMHAMTIAPTRTGKGTTAIIPNLLALNASVLVIDPKGENARRTAERRRKMGHKVMIVDPWQISKEPDNRGPGADPALLASYNPLDSLDPDSPDLATDAMMLADALVIPSGGENRFWDEEAKGLIFGIILFLVTDPIEKKRRTLGRLRQILTLPSMPGEDPEIETFPEIMVRMGQSENELVRASAARQMAKSDREGPGVLSAAQANTHFLDSPVLRESLARSDFSFGELKTADVPVTVYLVLPLDRLATFNRWLRLLVIGALKDLMRIPQPENKPAVRIILDEFAALKRLEMVREAYGTMAGLGVQLWIITQDLGQLEQLYGQAWQTFVGNAGVFQYFGSRDHKTAQYASQLTGMTTLLKRSTSQSSNADSTSNTVSYDDVQRPLAFPDELMTLPRHLELLFIENSHPIVAGKVEWFNDETMKALQEGREKPAEALRRPEAKAPVEKSPKAPQAASVVPPETVTAPAAPREPEPYERAMHKAVTKVGLIKIAATALGLAVLIAILCSANILGALFFGTVIAAAVFIGLWTHRFWRDGYDPEVEAAVDARFWADVQRWMGQATDRARATASAAAAKATDATERAKAGIEKRRQADE